MATWNLQKGTLSKYGYSTNLPIRKRHETLILAIEEYGPVLVLRKLNAVSILTRNKSPTKSKILEQDKQWVQKKYSTTNSAGRRVYDKKVASPVKRPVGRPKKAATPAKRPVGRPKKVASPVKRPVGRPRKAATPEKRPVGRPKKIATPAKRPVGRPKKIASPVK